MLAFHNDPDLKVAVLKSVSDVHTAERWTETRPRECDTKCLLHAGTFEDIETRLGIPIILLQLNDGMLYIQEAERTAFWNERFLRSCCTGADLTGVFEKFIALLFDDKALGIRKLLRSEMNCELFGTLLGALGNPSELNELKRRLLEFEAKPPDPTRMTQEYEPALKIIEFIHNPHPKAAADFMMCCAAAFQYAGKKGRGWNHLSKRYSEKFLEILLAI